MARRSARVVVVRRRRNRRRPRRPRVRYTVVRACSIRRPRPPSRRSWVCPLLRSLPGSIAVRMVLPWHLAICVLCAAVVVVVVAFLSTRVVRFVSAVTSAVLVMIRFLFGVSLSVPPHRCRCC